MGKLNKRLSELRASGARLARRVLEVPVYNAGLHLYAGAVKIAALRNEKAKKMAEGHRHINEILEKKIVPGKKYVWVHAASLGEFEQGRPIIERIRKNLPELGVVLTFFSPSGYEVRKNYDGADIVCYLPYDTSGNARKFVEKVNPEMAIFVKYEIWRNYLHELHEHDVPCYLVSAVFRPEQAFFKKRSSWYAGWLRYFKEIFVQDERSRKLLEGIGITDVTVAGDTRFDRVTDIRDARKEIPELKELRTRGEMLFMAGSSWPADEDVYASWLARHKEICGVIAPHEYDGARLRKLLGLFGDEAVLLSEVRKSGSLPEGKRVLIIDCFGLLSSAYAYADMAYVGGAFGAGLHNINEAAVYGIPVIFGPKFGKFLEARDLTEIGGGISIDSREAFEKTADSLLEDREELGRRGQLSADYIASKIGASDIIFDSLFKTKS